MSVWYSAEGSIKVRACEEAEQIVNNDLQYGEVCADYCDEGDGVATVEISGGDNVSNGSPLAFEEALRKLGAFVLHPTFVVTDQDGEKCNIYVGPPEKEAEALSHCTYDEIELMLMLEHLTVEDRHRNV
jgi:hypothetical protein